MQRNIVKAVVLLLLTVMGSRDVFGQHYTSTWGSDQFQMNVSRGTGDSARITTVIYRKDGPLYVLQMDGEKLLSLTVDGKPVPPDSFGSYKDLLETVKVKIKEAEEQMKRDREQAARDRVQAGRDREQAERDREQAGRDREQAEKDREQMVRDQEQAGRDRQQADREREQVEKEREHAGRDREQAERDRVQSMRDREQADRDREQAGRDREQAERDRKHAEEDRKLVDSLTRDLVRDGVIKQQEDIYELSINEHEIEVNGKRLPDALEKKYLAKYARKGNSMSYQHNPDK
jgi:hypothetical protein